MLIVILECWMVLILKYFVHCQMNILDVAYVLKYIPFSFYHCLIFMLSHSLNDLSFLHCSRRYPGVIQALYIGIQCSSCGIRFTTDCIEKYNEHLDWHFRQNRHEMEEIKVAKFRRLFYDVVVGLLRLVYRSCL